MVTARRRPRRTLRLRHSLRELPEKVRNIGAGRSMHSGMEPVVMLSLRLEIAKAVESQATESLINRCAQAARRCLYEYGLRREPGYERELVQDAITAILDCRISWDPRREDLQRRIDDVVRFRVRNEKLSLAARVQCVPVDSLDVLASSDETPDERLARERERSLGARIGEALQELAQASADGEVVDLLAYFRRDDVDRAGAMRVTGMSAEKYRNARRRLVRLRRHLPDDLRAQAAAVLSAALCEDGDAGSDRAEPSSSVGARRR